jgi:DNA invertase Pin-like site-specific DNA recombinase
MDSLLAVFFILFKKYIKNKEENVMIYGYTRVSTRKQLDGYGLDVQKKEILEKYSDAKIYEEQYTGAKIDRPVFVKLLAELRENDILVVSRLDRFARNTIEGIKVVEDLFERGVAIHILNIGLLEDTPMGRFFLTTMLAVAELERNMIIERTQTGKELAKQNPDFKDGRPRKYTDDELIEAVLLLEDFSYKQVVELTGISKSTLIRAKNNLGS